MAKEKMKRKNLDLREDDIRTLTIEAIRKDIPDFKNFAEGILRREAERIRKREQRNS